MSNAEVGDVVQLLAPGASEKFHSMVVTKKANGTIYFTYHSGPNNKDVVDNPLTNLGEYTFYLLKF